MKSKLPALFLSLLLTFLPLSAMAEGNAAVETLYYMEDGAPVVCFVGTAGEAFYVECQALEEGQFCDVWLHDYETSETIYSFRIDPSLKNVPLPESLLLKPASWLLEMVIVDAASGEPDEDTRCIFPVFIIEPAPAAADLPEPQVVFTIYETMGTYHLMGHLYEGGESQFYFILGQVFTEEGIENRSAAVYTLPDGRLYAESICPNSYSDNRYMVIEPVGDGYDVVGEVSVLRQDGRLLVIDAMDTSPLFSENEDGTFETAPGYEDLAALDADAAVNQLLTRYFSPFGVRFAAAHGIFHTHRALCGVDGDTISAHLATYAD